MTPGEVYRNQAIRAIVEVERRPGMTHAQVGRRAGLATGRLRMLQERGYLDAVAEEQCKAIVYVPPKSINGVRLVASGWMVTTSVQYAALNVAWLRKHRRTRAFTAARSSAVALLGKANHPVAALVNAEVAIFQASDAYFEQLEQDAAQELLRQMTG